MRIWSNICANTRAPPIAGDLVAAAHDLVEPAPREDRDDREDRDRDHQLDQREAARRGATRGAIGLRLVSFATTVTICASTPARPGMLTDTCTRRNTGFGVDAHALRAHQRHVALRAVEALLADLRPRMREMQLRQRVVGAPAGEQAAMQIGGVGAIVPTARIDAASAPWRRSRARRAPRSS
jgi:hypothetical protein